MSTDILTQLVSTIRSDYGQETCFRLSDPGLISNIKDWLSTQSFAIDRACGYGIPVGRITTIVGHRSHGKTSICNHLMAETQRRGGIAIYADTEHCFNLEWAKTCGVNTETMIILYPEYLEQVFEMISSAVKQVRDNFDPCPLITCAIDSLSSLATKSEIEQEDKYDESSTKGEHARILSKALRRLITNRVLEHPVTLLLVGQYKDKLNFRSSFLPQEFTILGDRPIGFHETLRIEVKRIRNLKTGKDKSDAVPYGIECLATIKKNKVFPPFRVAPFRIRFDKGLDRVYDLFNISVELGIIRKAGGAWYIYNNQKFMEKEFVTSVNISQVQQQVFQALYPQQGHETIEVAAEVSPYETEEVVPTEVEEDG